MLQCCIQVAMRSTSRSTCKRPVQKNRKRQEGIEEQGGPPSCNVCGEGEGALFYVAMQGNGVGRMEEGRRILTSTVLHSTTWPVHVS